MRPLCELYSELYSLGHDIHTSLPLSVVTSPLLLGLLEPALLTQIAGAGLYLAVPVSGPTAALAPPGPGHPASA
jgi:hypothetical protein